MSRQEPGITVAAVAGFRAEAGCLRGQDVTVAFSGGSAERARSEAERLLAEGAAALVSFGLAGGLAPGLQAGDLVLPETVRNARSASWSVDPVWRERVHVRLARGGLEPKAGALVGSERIVATASDKRALFEAVGALAVDMESHAVAAVAAEAEIPFLVLRAVADPADQVVPQVAREALRPDGASGSGPRSEDSSANPASCSRCFASRGRVRWRWLPYGVGCVSPAHGWASRHSPSDRAWGRLAPEPKGEPCGETVLRGPLALGQPGDLGVDQLVVHEGCRAMPVERDLRRHRSCGPDTAKGRPQRLERMRDGIRTAVAS